MIAGLGLRVQAGDNEDVLSFVKQTKESEKTETKSDVLHIGFHAGNEKPEQKDKINEADLLKDDVIVKKSKPEDCSVKPKACANCKCGRKEQEQK